MTANSPIRPGQRSSLYSLAMILTRLTAHLRSQNWFAVVLEFIIVAVGVVMGLQVSNWNDNRLCVSRV
jgi:hypothetical protein